MVRSKQPFEEFNMEFAKTSFFDFSGKESKCIALCWEVFERHGCGNLQGVYFFGLKRLLTAGNSGFTRARIWTATPSFPCGKRSILTIWPISSTFVKSPG